MVYTGMIEITRKPISPETVINQVKTESSGCVATYVGLIRHLSQGKQVLSVEYEDPKGTAKDRLGEIASEIRQKWPVNNVAICHRIGKLEVGDINVVFAIAAAHREDGFAACQYAVDRFKEIMPTRKKETYTDGSFRVEGGR
jgi:molybdopterin synthase catalytic subunit